MASRRKSRELALQMLFQWEQGHHAPQAVLRSFFAGRKDEPEVERFATELFQGAVAEVEVLDRHLREASENWRPERMAAVDRNLLRLALFEFLHHPETPPAVVI